MRLARGLALGLVRGVFALVRRLGRRVARVLVPTPEKGTWTNNGVVLTSSPGGAYNVCPSRTVKYVQLMKLPQAIDAAIWVGAYGFAFGLSSG